MGKTNQKPIPCELVSPDAEAIARQIFTATQDVMFRVHREKIAEKIIAPIIAERNRLIARVTELEAALAKYTDPVRDAGNMEPNDHA